MMLVKVLASGFYARQNIKTPVKIAVVALVVNIALNFVLVGPLKHAGLALASSLAAVTNSSLLFFFLLRQKIFRLRASWCLFLLRLVIAGVTMAAVLYYFRV
jgi:putative peptidoglycan lipid II flippase